MPRPDGGLITETNRQYYAGAQQFYISSAGAGKTFTSTFNTDLIFGSSDNASAQYGLNNFHVYSSPDALTWTELTPNNSKTTAVNVNANVATGTQTLTITVANINIVAGMLIQNSAGTQTYGTVTQALSTTTFTCAVAIQIPANAALVFKFAEPYTEVNNVITINSYLAAGSYLKIQLTESTIENNYGDYSYTKLTDVIDNFLIAYVGAGKLIPSVKRTDVIFHARRGLQEFSYDTLRSIKSQELTVNNALSVILPQDYVNYVRFSWIDKHGVQHTIYPANELTTNPYANPVQDDNGTPTQDNFDSNIQSTSQTEEAWAKNDPRNISGAYTEEYSEANIYWQGYYNGALGQRYGLEPVTSQKNGWFTINDREGKISFSSDLKGKLIILEYISDGNAYNMDVKIPKLSEEALYAYIMHAILSTSANVQEYVVRRFKKEASAKLRNAKIRLSNIKLDQIIQVMRGQSKWIKN
tara:strand:+ start:869 stop:2278 length:1410 start_codon:yes stop_codon:yes gene_type:complete